MADPQKITLPVSLLHYSASNTLPGADQELIRTAMATAANAYAPFSRFQVGCALRLANGRLLEGNNQENIAYPSGLCAERVALFHAGAVYPGEPVQSLAIYASAHAAVLKDPIFPCGACLQVMAEYERRQQSPIRILIAHQDGSVYEAESVAVFLPFGFYTPYLDHENQS